MGSNGTSLLRCLHISILFFLASSVVAHDARNKLQNYVVFVREAIDIDTSVLKNVENWHNSLLSTVCENSGASRLIYSYNTVVNGFAARLTETEVEEMSKHPWFVRAILANNRYKMMTTDTPDFLKLRGPGNFWSRTKNMGEGVIIGVIDSGIWPEHPSFHDKGMPSLPAKWKGHCDFNATFCNNKLIGAKSFLNAGAEERKHISPFDIGRHGTHTASTAAGAIVENASFPGHAAMGSASGMAPKAHIAVYRVCSDNGCEEADILKGIEEAVKDGCDVLSISLGGISKTFNNDAIAIGAFTANLKGVFVSTSAGNEGPFASTLSNEVPWLLTVAASTISRRFVSTVKLGNGLEIDGESIYQPSNWTNSMFPLVYLGKAVSAEAGQCLNETLDRKIVTGKIVVCDHGGGPRLQKGQVVRDAGGVGVIIVNAEKSKYETMPDNNVLPASDVTYSDGEKIKNYISSTGNPVSTFLFKGVMMDNMWSPSIASFSSRGPNTQSRFILKPDIAGPGVRILAAVPPEKVGGEVFQFALMSGTSMACPHLTGIAALIKKAHPNWSPAAIKSAIMTTAYYTALNRKPITNGNYLPANALDMGAGHVDPNKALDPGLVYDTDPKDYIRYLCGLGYNDYDVQTVIQPLPPVKCAEVKAIHQEQLNYPSIAVPPSKNGMAVIYRTVTNVGDEKDTYTALITVPAGVSATVVPDTLNFSRVFEKKTFKIIFKWTGVNMKNSFGDLKWVSKNHVVRSPIAILA